MKKKILVIDDNPDMLRLIESMLLRGNYEIELILEWEIAYRKIQEFQPDLIVLDAYLNGMDGRIICRNLKCNEETRHIPVMVISAHAIAANAVKEYSADAFMSKPFFRDELLNEVKQCMKNDTE